MLMHAYRNHYYDILGRLEEVITIAAPTSALRLLNMIKFPELFVIRDHQDLLLVGVVAQLASA